MEDALIIELYWQRNEDAIKETDNKYGAYCFSVANNVLRDKGEAEECVNDTYLRAWNAMPPKRPSLLRAFLAKITRRLAFNRYDANAAKKRGGGETAAVLEELAECIASETDVESEYMAKELGECVRNFVNTLPERDGNVFVRRYFFVDTVGEIAKRYGLKENNVAVILSRTRAKLKKTLEREGYFCEQK